MARRITLGDAPMALLDDDGARLYDARYRAINTIIISPWYRRHAVCFSSHFPGSSMLLMSGENMVSVAGKLKPGDADIHQ